MADSLAELQEALDALIEERDWAQFHAPKNLAMGVAIEAAEIMEHFQWCTADESYSLPKEKRAEVANEIGDVLLYLLGLGRTLDIDIIAAARDKLVAHSRKVPDREGEGARDEVRRSRLTVHRPDGTERRRKRPRSGKGTIQIKVLVGFRCQNRAGRTGPD